jgi:hypothetical protein
MELFGPTSNNSRYIPKPDEFVALLLVMGRHIDEHPKILQPLQNLLIRHREPKYKDPRDRIFTTLEIITLSKWTHLGKLSLTIHFQRIRFS